MEVPHVLRTFAELSRDGDDFQANVLRHDYDFVWLQSSSEALFSDKAANAVAWTTSRKDALLEQAPDEDKVDRLIGSGELHKTEQLLRAGWLWIAGRVTTDDGPTDYCFPLLSVPVSRTTSIRARARQVPELFKSGVASVYRVLEPVGDVELAPMIGDEDRRELLGEINPQDSGAFASWRERAAVATGLDVDHWMAPDDGTPGRRSHEAGLVAFAGVGLYLHQLPKVRTQRQALLQLALTKDAGTSALGAIYTSKESRSEAPRKPVSVRPLTSRQATVAANAGCAELAVISGAPGTGKTHVLSAIAVDAVTKQQSVLVVGSTRYATDVLLEHFAKIGSIKPVVFGSSRHRKRFAELLVASEAPSKEAGDRIEHDLLDATQSFAYEREALLHRSDPAYEEMRLAQLERAGDLDDLEKVIERYFIPRPADLFRNHGQDLEYRLDLDLSELERALGGTEELRSHLEGQLRDRRSIEAATQRSSHDSDGIAQNLDELVRLSDALTLLEAEWIQHTHLSNLTPHEEYVRVRLRGIMLEDNRSHRARRLRDIDVRDMTAAKLWVGALEDVNEILSRTAGFFDIVIIDEAAQISQPEAAGALLRGKKAILCGDPQQLRHQTNLSSGQVRAATEMFGTDPDVLDVAAHSILDVVASRVPAQLLNEHFRSAPHLIEFSNRRFYGGGLKTTTRHPSNEAADHIQVAVVPTRQRTNGANRKEALHCITFAEMFIERGWRSIGFVSPFDAQAELLEELILEAYSVDEIDKYGLRVGTVRAFQGDERDVMILSWAVGADEDERAWDLVNQDALFNVMVTRAKHQVVVVTSHPSPPGLAGEYVKWAEPLEDLEVDTPPSHHWVQSVTQELRTRGIPIRTGYRVGEHLIDVVAGTAKSSVAIDCVPHGDGVDAHIERVLTLRRAGWRTSEAYERSWGYRLDELASDLTRQFPDLID